MGMVKHYLVELYCLGANAEQEDAIEWAIISEWIPLTYHRDTDTRNITLQLPSILDAYRRRVEELEEVAA